MQKVFDFLSIIVYTILKRMDKRIQVMGWANTRTRPTKRTGVFYTDPITGKTREVALHKTVREIRMTVTKKDWFTEPEKIEAAALYAATNSIEKVHEIQGVPRYLLKRWQKEGWWDNVISQCRKEKNEQLDGLLTVIIDKAAKVIDDRLEFGELEKNRKTGEEFRVPARIRDATHALEVTFKQRQLLRGEATSRTESLDSNTKLTQLKDQFEKLARSKQVNTKEPLEGEYVTVSETGDGSEEGPDSISETEVASQGKTSEGSGRRDVIQDGEINEAEEQETIFMQA